MATTDKPRLVEPAEYEWGERRWVKLEELADSVDLPLEEVWEECQLFYGSETSGLGCWLDKPDGVIHNLSDSPKALYRVLVPRAGMRQLRNRLDGPPTRAG